MTPPRKDVQNDAHCQIENRKRRKPISGIECLEHSCLREHMSSILLILAKYLHMENDDEKMETALFDIGRAMLPVMMNKQQKEHFTLVEFFILNLESLGAYRTEIMTAMVKKVTELQLAKKWCNMRVPCDELRERTKRIGDEIRTVLGIKNLLGHVPYSVVTFCIALYSTIVNENSNLYRASYVAKFRNPEEFSFDIIRTPDFDQFLEFLVQIFEVVARIVKQIREEIQVETESLVGVQRLSPDGLRRRDNVKALVDKLHRRLEEETKKEEDRVDIPPAPVQLRQNDKNSSPDSFQLLSRYVNIRNEDIGTEFYKMVHEQTRIELSEIKKFFVHLLIAREMMAWQFDAQSAEDFSRLYH